MLLQAFRKCSQTSSATNIKPQRPTQSAVLARSVSAAGSWHLAPGPSFKQLPSLSDSRVCIARWENSASGKASSLPDLRPPVHPQIFKPPITATTPQRLPGGKCVWPNGRYPHVPGSKGAMASKLPGRLLVGLAKWRSTCGCSTWPKLGAVVEAEHCISIRSMPCSAQRFERPGWASLLRSWCRHSLGIRNEPTATQLKAEQLL